MPRSKKLTPPENNNVDIPIVENGGKVLSTDGEAIDIPEAVRFDDAPVIPKTPPPKKEEQPKKKEADTDKAVDEIISETVTKKPASKYDLEKKIVEIGCILADRLLGEHKDLNTNPIPDKQMASIECLLNIYRTTRG